MVKPEEKSRHVSADSNPSPLGSPVSYDDKWSCHQTARCGVVTSLLHIANDEVSHIALPGPVIETTPCHLLFFLLFPVLPTT